VVGRVSLIPAQSKACEGEATGLLGAGIQQTPAYYLILNVLPLFAWPPALADLCVCIRSEISCFLCN